MPKQIIIPVTEKDFQGLEIMILNNSDEFCSYCNKELEEYILKDGMTVAQYGKKKL